jgi:hypothetical protein
MSPCFHIFMHQAPSQKQETVFRSAHLIALRTTAFGTGRVQRQEARHFFVLMFFLEPGEKKNPPLEKNLVRGNFC